VSLCFLLSVQTHHQLHLAAPLPAPVAKQQQRKQKQQQQDSSKTASSGALEALSLPLVVRVAQQAPDAAVRNAALSLLAVLAAAKPQAVLSHVLEVGMMLKCVFLQADTYG